MLKNILLLFIIFDFVVASSVDIVYTSRLRDINDAKHGDYSNLSTVLKKYRKNSNVLFVYGGKCFGPSLTSKMDKGASILGILNILKPDVFGANDSDLIYSADELSLRASEANFPFVLSNVKYEDGEGLYGILPYFMLEKNGIKIGVISVLDKEARYRYNIKNVVISDYIYSTQKYAKILRQKGADFVLALSSGYAPFPARFFDDGILDFAISQNINYGKYKQNHKHVLNLYKRGQFAILKVVKKDGKIGYDVRSDFLNNYKQDESIKKFVSKYMPMVSEFLAQNICSIQVPINTNMSEFRFKESVFFNLLTDAIREYTKADVVLINSGIIKGMGKVFKKGSFLTRKDILDELVFRDKLVLLKVKGSTILSTLEHGIKDTKNGSGKFLHISGGRFEYDSSIEYDRRLKKVFIGGSRLDKNKIYTLATVEFLHHGGDKYLMLKDAKVIKNYKLDLVYLADIFIDYLKAKKKINAKLEGRIVDLGVKR